MTVPASILALAFALVSFALACSTHDASDSPADADAAGNPGASDNDSGNLDAAAPPAPGRIVEDAVAIDSAGGLLLRGSAIWSWGHDTPVSMRDPRLQIALPSTAVTSLAGNEAIFCGMLASGGVGCVADEHFASLTTIPALTLVPGTEGVKQLAVGGQHACALDADGTIVCWGRGGNGQLGNGYDATHGSGDRTLVRVGVPGQFVRVVAGARGTCGVQSDRSVSCWGDTLGEHPGNVWGGAPADAVAMGGSEGTTLVCALFGTSVRCNRLGSSVSAVVLEGVDAIGAGSDQVCGHEVTGGIVCFGYYPVAGDSESTTPELWTIKGVPADAKPLPSFSENACALEAGNLYCWGRNAAGQLGADRTTVRPLDQAYLMPF